MDAGVRVQTILSILKGLGVAVAITLLGMALLAAIVIFTPISDGALTALNQVLKVASVFFGVLCAVKRGGERGLALGALVGLLYMILGYAAYCMIDAALAPAGQMALEFAMGALIGAVSGVICANMKPRKRRSGLAKRAKLA